MTSINFVVADNQRLVGRANATLAIALLIILTLSVLPLGSAQAFSWGISAALLGTTGLVYCLVLFTGKGALRAGIGTMRLQFGCMALVVLFLVAQCLPIAGSLGIGTPALGRVPQLTISLSPGMTTLMVVRQLSYGLYFFLLVQCTVNEQRRSFVLDAILSIVVLEAAIALVSLQSGDVILGLVKWAYSGVATGTFVNRNNLATFLALGTCVAAAQIGGALRPTPGSGSASRSLARILVCALAYAFLIYVILASQSRMGLFTALSSSVVVFLIMVMGQRNWLSLLVFLLVAGGISIAALVLINEGLFERFVSTEQSAISRAALYAQVVELIAQRPWLGFGGGSFELAFPLVHKAPVASDLLWDRAHNTYLTLWAELGLFFGSLPMLAVLATGGSIIARIASADRSSTRAPAAAAVGAILTVALHSLVDFSLEIQSVTYLFVAILACGSAAAFATSKQRKQDA